MAKSVACQARDEVNGRLLNEERNDGLHPEMPVRTDKMIVNTPWALIVANSRIINVLKLFADDSGKTALPE